MEGWMTTHITHTVDTHMHVASLTHSLGRVDVVSPPSLAPSPALSVCLSVSDQQVSLLDGEFLLGAGQTLSHSLHVVRHL